MTSHKRLNSNIEVLLSEMTLKRTRNVGSWPSGDVTSRGFYDK